jgi:uncharacterized membrane protein YgdD (TMEM256/DUF423 family)
MSNSRVDKIFIILGSINAAFAVALGALGAHGLKRILTPEWLAIYQTAVHYHMIHALGLLCIGILAQRYSTTLWLKGAGYCLLAGIILFSGSLYALSLSELRFLGAITPIGGISFIGGWIFLAIAIWKETD